MKMVKSLLLGSAAGLVAMAGAQAADLPVKAKPVEYVKVCSLYGAGFYYIPGTDTCLKIGGFVRAEYELSTRAARTPPYWHVGSGRDTRQTRRAYNRVHAASSPSMLARRRNTARCARIAAPAGNCRATRRNSVHEGDYRGRRYFDRAFIQFAGFTFGKTQSFFDFYANALNYTTTVIAGSDTGGTGINLIAYTATVRWRLLGDGRRWKRTPIAAPACGASASTRSRSAQRQRSRSAELRPTTLRQTLPGHRREPAGRSTLGFGADHGRDPRRLGCLLGAELSTDQRPSVRRLNTDAQD